MLFRSLVGMLFLINMELAWWEAAALFGLWFIQFIFSAIPPGAGPLGYVSGHMHVWMTITYWVWAGWEIVRMLFGRRQALAISEFRALWGLYIHPKNTGAGHS